METPCKLHDKGRIWNEEEVGKDEVTEFANKTCEVAACPTKLTLTAENLPWFSELSEIGTTICDEITGMQLHERCEGTISITWKGSLSPKINPTNGAAGFDASAGGLENSGLTLTATGTDAIEQENGSAVRVK